MINPLLLRQNNRDYWSRWGPAVIPSLDRLCDPSCLTPRFVSCPDDQTWILPANGYIEYVVSLVPGSWIWGWGVAASDQGAIADQGRFQIYDYALKRYMFNAPLDFGTLGNRLITHQEDNMSYLAEPYPITGKGILSVEVWNSALVAQRTAVQLFYSEPKGQAATQ